MNDPVHDDRLSQIYEQMPKEQVPEHIKKAILDAAHQQAVINAQKAKLAAKSDNNGLKQWFSVLLMGIPAYGWVGVAVCILAVVVVFKPSTSSDPLQTVNQQAVIKQNSPHTTDNVATTTEQKPINTLRVAPVESADSFRLPEESVQVAEGRSIPRIEIHGRVEPVSNTESDTYMSNHVSIGTQNTVESSLLNIRLLKELGKQQEASKALKAFQQQYPQQSVPKDLQDLTQQADEETP